MLNAYASGVISVRACITESQMYPNVLSE